MTPHDEERAARRFALRYVLLAAAVVAALLAAFLLVQALGAGPLVDPQPWLAGGGLVAALVGCGLIVADVVFPVPSSLIMIAHGALFGIPLGAALSLLGATGAALVGYGLGRCAGLPIVRRVCSPAERARARDVISRWGLLAVVASRPVPLLAETVTLVAGAERLGGVRVAAAALLGALPGALLYAAAGAVGAEGPSGLVVVALVLVITTVLWLIGRFALTRRSAEDGRTVDSKSGPGAR